MNNIQDTIIDNIIKKLWKNYKNKVPQANIIENAIKQKQDIWVEDHIAFRTLPGKNCGLNILKNIFELLGYKKSNNYKFQDKKISAISMNPPHQENKHSTKVFPKVFISALYLEGFSSSFVKCINNYTADVTLSPIDKFKSEFNLLKKYPQRIDDFSESIALFLNSGAMWRKPIYKDYETLRKESEYAAWTLAFGNTPNHFTVSVHLMNNFKSLKEFNNFIESELKIKLNNAGGSIIKGTPEVMLEQSATLAEEILVPFQDGFQKIPYAFVEFAYRFTLEGKKHDGIWDNYYQGFVTSNADKIFESTNFRK